MAQDRLGNMVGVKILTPIEVDECWSRIAPFIESGLPKEVILMDLDDVALNLKAGIWICAIAFDGDMIDGAVVLSSETFPKCRVVSIISLGGKEGRKWFDKMSDLIDNVRRMSGARYILFSGREGWSRERPEFRKTASVYYRGEA